MVDADEGRCPVESVDAAVGIVDRAARGGGAALHRTALVAG